MLPKNDCDNLGFKDIFAVAILTFVIELTITTATLVYTSLPFLVYYLVALKKNDRATYLIQCY